MYKVSKMSPPTFKAPYLQNVFRNVKLIKPFGTRLNPIHNLSTRSTITNFHFLDKRYA